MIEQQPIPLYWDSSSSIDEKTLAGMRASGFKPIPISLADLAELADNPLKASSSKFSSVVCVNTEELILLAQGLDLTPDERPSLKASLSSLEQNLIKKALDEADGNVSRCAKLLKIQRTTLIERIKKYELGF